MITEITLDRRPNTAHADRVMTLLKGSVGCVVSPDRRKIYAFGDDHILIANELARECNIHSTIKVLS